MEKLRTFQGHTNIFPISRTLQGHDVLSRTIQGHVYAMYQHSEQILLGLSILSFHLMVFSIRHKYLDDRFDTHPGQV